MPGVAVLMNESELEHNAGAELRPLLEEWDLTERLYTAGNITELGDALRRGELLGIVCTSNALSDRALREELGSAELRKALARALAGSCGLLVLSQLRIAEASDPALSFLPPELGAVRLRKRSEPAAQGELAHPLGAAQHLTLRFPHRIDLGELGTAALRNPSRKGLYWHWWDVERQGEWEPLIVDVAAYPGATGSAGPGTTRPLVLVARHSSRVVLCSIPVDWGLRSPLLRNLIDYTVHGRCLTGLVRASDEQDRGMEYLCSTLAARRYAYRVYRGPVEANLAIDNTLAGVHTTLLLGPGVQYPSAAADKLDERLRDGSLRIISVPSQRAAELRVRSHERATAKLLREARFAALADLASPDTGHWIDHSFWSTIETLLAFDELAGARQGLAELTVSEGAVADALKEAAAREVDGSFDETFAASCGLVWLRARYLGADDAATRRTERWVRARLASQVPRDQLMAYLLLHRAGLGGADDTQSASQLLATLDSAHASAVDLVVYLRAALTFDHGHATAFAGALAEQVQRLWINPAVNAAAVEVLVRFISRQPHRDALGAVLAAVNALRGQLEAAQAQGTPPWSGKTSTLTRCAKALWHFDELVDFPVDALVTLLEDDAGARAVTARLETATDVLDRLRTQNDEQREQLRRIREEREELLKRQRTLQASSTHAHSQARRWRAATATVTFLLGAAAYVGAFLAYGFATARQATLRKALQSGFGSLKELHIGLLTTIGLASLVALYRLWTSAVSGHNAEAEPARSESREQDGRP